MNRLVGCGCGYVQGAQRGAWGHGGQRFQRSSGFCHGRTLDDGSLPEYFAQTGEFFRTAFGAFGQAGLGLEVERVVVAFEAARIGRAGRQELRRRGRADDRGWGYAACRRSG